MVDSIFTGTASYNESQDSPRVVEAKLNKIFSDLYSLYPGLNSRRTIKMTVSSADGTVDSPLATQGKINAMFADLYGAAGLPAPSIELSQKDGRSGGINARAANQINVAATALATQPALGTLTLAPLTGTHAVAYAGTFGGASTGSTLAATGLPAGVTLNSAGRTLSGTPTTAGSYNIAVTETDAGYRGSGKVTNFTLVIA